MLAAALALFTLGRPGAALLEQRVRQELLVPTLQRATEPLLLAARRMGAPLHFVRESARKAAYRVLHLSNHGEAVLPHVCVFMIGLPGAGKSRLISKRYERLPSGKESASTVVVDLDREICQHPEYDPADPDKLYLDAAQVAYRWADSRVEEQFTQSLANPAMARIVVDGTGTNVQRQIRRMAQAREAGWFVKVLYVRVPAKTAIARAALRSRVVSAGRITSYQKKMAAAMQAAAEHADEVEIVDVTFDDVAPPGMMRGTCVDSITAILG